MIHYQKASLFNAPEGSLIVHAVNCRGVWGSRIAREFKKRYPSSFKSYKLVCDLFGNSNIGNYFIDFISKPHKVRGLFTSEDYGMYVDSSEQILVNTTRSVYALLESVRESNIDIVYSNKFNSGLFNVPWEETEEVLKKVLKDFPEIE